jgi:hypothetical protein
MPRSQKSAQAEASLFHTAAMTASLSGKCCPRSPSFIGLKDGSLKVLNRGYMVDVIGQTSQTLQSARWSPNWYGVLRYHVTSERLSVSLA